MRTRVKICGITRQQDADFAAESGADAIGLVFYPPSPRAISFAQANTITANLAPFVSKVALFVDPDKDLVSRCLDELSVDILQFHGDESPDFCHQFEMPYLKAVRMRDGVNLQEVADDYSTASALLLDTYQPGLPGGTGKTFDWSQISRIDKPIILAGGLHASNVLQAIHQVQPYAVDVSGGVESDKGIKSHEKISTFMREVANA
ncbi:MULTISPECIES: phosphoribosylanthranilate isomerase [Methylophaga]|jgi:phosphoribosylanthranilate isomerase|uniref:N-(5'-phosphoribosyl)anthranilate isomerase n=2 Tax=Methylophaga TaxID=40222 RepID=A0ABN0TEM1_9GAMM|nr:MULTISPECIES: phosphoribosylanthranilate isomerase [Methylophaga]MAX51069.1 phosphoribosylanthranilate isomerase [Methylophaga sp.]BDZ72648.1 N-(5'-phosphoribosyl)anthranilate isomerase [Methylophaga marina]GLP98814.1 N-(5'-phosphoribosyl)anthranilate isomerase [Methylophaga thalassica]|tara:strand:+ start:1101 stop:1715 length:615 start_codon:yes stop_codon:yes gene_type:complete